MTAEIDRTLYDLFERCVRTARKADVYNVSLTDERPDGSSNTYGRQLDNTEEELVPWGTIGGIKHVEWYPGGTWQPWRPLEGDKRHVRVGYHEYYLGITVHTGLHEYSDPLDEYVKRYIFGVAGTIKPLRDCVALPNEDAVVARVLGVIEKAYRVIADERNQPYDEHAEGLADDASTTGLLSELGAFERVTGEQGGWVI